MKPNLFRASLITSLMSGFSILVLLVTQKESAATISFVLGIAGFLTVHIAKRSSVMMKDLSKRKTLLSIVEEVFEISVLVGLSLGSLIPRTEALAMFSMLLILKVLERDTSKIVSFEGFEYSGTKARTFVLMIALGVSAFFSSFTFYIGMLYVSLTSYRVLAILYRFIEELMQVKLKNRIFSN